MVQTQRKFPQGCAKAINATVLHRATLAVPSLPPPTNGSLRQAALASVQRQQTVAALPVSTKSAKKRPASPSVPSPSNLSPLAQRIRKDIGVGESEIESPEKEVLRSPTFLENSPSPLSPRMKEIPPPAPLVFTPSKIQEDAAETELEKSKDAEEKSKDAEEKSEESETESAPGESDVLEIVLEVAEPDEIELLSRLPYGEEKVQLQLQVLLKARERLRNVESVKKQKELVEGERPKCWNCEEVFTVDHQCWNS